MRKTAQILLQNDIAICLVTILETHGSTPRDKNTQMLVTESELFGTIGGGNLEMHAIESAQKMLRENSAPQTLDYILGPDMEQCCGGRVKLSLKILDDLTGFTPQGRRVPLYLFGAGHVGTALLNCLKPLPFDVHCFDNRPDKISSKPNQPIRFLPPDFDFLDNAPNHSFYLIMTHDHALDYDLVLAILQKGDVQYCGMIGSQTKRARFLSRLKKDGLSPTQISRLTCPIGIEGIQGKEPEIIAASVAAQLLIKRDQYEH